MVRLTDHPECRRASHDRATPSVELPCCAAASSPAAQTSMSACARRASACGKRPNQSAHALALYPMCRGSRTGTSRGCTGFAHGVGHRWPWHGATGTESDIRRVVNQDGTCARRMVALDRLPSGVLSRQQGRVIDPVLYVRGKRGTCGEQAGERGGHLVTATERKRQGWGKGIFIANAIGIAEFALSKAVDFIKF